MFARRTQDLGSVRWSDSVSEFPASRHRNLASMESVADSVFRGGVNTSSTSLCASVPDRFATGKMGLSESLERIGADFAEKPP